MKHSTSSIIRHRLQKHGVPFNANDSIAAHINPGELKQLQTEVQDRVADLLDALVIDVQNDHNTQDTARRVAKMFICETMGGRYSPPPALTVFPNVKKLDELMSTGPITVRSSCSHHLCPVVGRCWVGIIPGTKLLGLSKFNRVVDWFASRPQIQEELVVQLADYIEETVKPKGVAVVIEAEHLCMTWRGVRESSTTRMTNSVMRGSFRDHPATRAEFLAFVTKC